MRRWIAAALSVLALALTACGASGSQAGSATPTTSKPSTSAVTTAPKAGDAEVTNAYNPCTLITADDLKAVFTATSVTMIVPDGYDPSNPPANNVDAERSCAYSVTVTGLFGANPASTTYQFTVMVTTYGEDAAGDVWTSMMQGQHLDTSIGAGAFFANQGDLTFHKGKASVRIWSVDDTNGTLDNAKATALAMRALGRIS